jgi:hypothetical protein
MDYLVIIKVRYDGNIPRIIVKITLFFFRISVVPGPSTIGYDCFSSLLYVTAEELFMIENRRDVLDCLFQDFLEPFMKNHPEKEKCLQMLRDLRKRRLIMPLLLELKVVPNKKEAKRILKFIHKKIVNKIRGIDVNPVLENKCAFIMLGKAKTRTMLHRYVRWVSICIETARVHRIYLLATGTFNVSLATILDRLLQEDVKLEKVMEERYQRHDTGYPSIVIGYER